MQTRRQAIFSILSVTFLWGIPPLFIHYFRHHFDAHTQNFWRYASALAFLWIYIFWNRQRGPASWRRALPRTVVAAAVLVTYQTLFTSSLYYAKPAFIGLLIQTELVVAVALSCLFFADERATARSPWFIAGAVAAMAGATGIVVFSLEFSEQARKATDSRAVLIAVVLVGTGAVFWACYSVAVKWCLEVMRPFPAFITIETIATVAFFVLAMGWGEPKSIVRVPGSVVWMVVGTGVGCIALAHIFYTGAVERLGVVVCNTVILGSPVVTAACSRIFFDERLTFLQIVSAVILLAGAAAAVHARARLRARRAVLPPQ